MREFWIADPERYSCCSYCGECLVCSEDSKDIIGYEGNTFHVREVNPAYDEAVKGLVEAVEFVNNECGYASPWQIKMTKALEAFRKVTEK